MSSPSPSPSDELKAIGNERFKRGDYSGAEASFTEALETGGPTAILYTNRAAARFNMGKMLESLSDTDESIAIDPKWGKAYYRKACALESLKRHKEAMDCWNMALKTCDGTPWLTTQHQEATQKWLKIMRAEPVESIEDFVERFKLLSDPREKLSTLAHFWNESSDSERLTILLRFAAIIGGSAGPSEELLATLKSVKLEALPMDNYLDLPITRITAWQTYYKSCEEPDKVHIFEYLWNLLSSVEQGAVINDLKFFIIK